MSKISPYLLRRGDRFSFRIAIPNDLRPYLNSREIIQSLKTTDRQAAIPKALALAASAKTFFEQVRRELCSVDEEKLKRLMHEWKHKHEIDMLKDEYKDEKIELRREYLRKIEQAKIQAKAEALQELLQSNLVAHFGRQHEHVPVANEKEEARPQHQLSELLPIWKRLRDPAKGSIAVYEPAVKRFEQHYPELSVEKIERKHMRDYVAWLQNENKSAKTIDKEHGALRALLNIAIGQDWIEANPAAGIALPKSKGGKSVRSYEPDEVALIFKSPVFASGARPAAGKGEAAYWVPLLLLFTGARREEICQLTAERIRSIDGIHYLAIDPIEDDGRLKTKESKRAVPIHKELIRLGFLHYVEAIETAGGGQLFPKLKPNARDQYGAKWGDWWGKYIRNTVGLTDKNIQPAHSFRHLFITECRRLNFRRDYEYALVGHSGEGVRKDAHDGYGEHLISSLAEIINQIDFRGADLSHLLGNAFALPVAERPKQ